MRTAILPVMLLAGLGFTLSLFAHLFALAGVQLPAGRAVLALHGGVFLVWLPTVLVILRVTRGVARTDVWKVALSGSPRWMKWALWGVCGYAALNFILFVATGGSRGVPAGGPTEVRGFSGHWLVFYGVAFVVMYSIRSRPSLLRERRCPAQHVMSPSAEYCEKCGQRVSAPESGA